MLRKVVLSDVPPRKRLNAVLANEIRTFADSDWAAAKVDVTTYKKAASAYSQYRYMIEKLGLTSCCSVIKRGDNVFLIKK